MCELEELAEEYDARFVDLPLLRLAARERSGVPREEKRRRRAKSPFGGEQYRRWAMGVAKEKRTGEGYWAREWFDLE